MDLLTVGVVVVVLLVLVLFTGLVFGSQAKAKLSTKLHGKDWIVRSETAFPLRTNCYVELYQDAAVCPGFPPPLVDGNGQPINYVPGACWENVFNAINEAERFIYITGWSVDTTKTLLRTTRNSASGGDDETIGQLLKRKAKEGCHVLLHLWNEKMSISTGDQVHSSGLMGIHDEDTLVYFRNTPVQVVLSYRHGQSSDYSYIFTHHQKSVIVDAPVLAEVEQSKVKGEQRKEEAKLKKKEKKELKKAMKERGEEVSESEKKEKKDKKKKDSDSEDEKKKKKKDKKKGSDSEDSDDKKKKKDKKKKGSDSENEDEKKKDTKEKSAQGTKTLQDYREEGRKYLLEQYSKHYQDYQEKVLSKLSTAGKRRIIAFIGGLDLTDGRWDTPVHSLYRTLKHEHSEDFHNVWPVSAELGPREPWHDIHCKLEGPVARDVLENFVQRWKKQAPHELHDFLLDTSPKNGFISIEQEQGNYKDASELWNVQLFRSIDKNSATISGIDASIQECYINAIRHAERFIYVENQYFLGSCQYWEKDKDVGCTNIIPFEIVNKICSKIRSKEQFNVYVVIPMYPEGIPEDGAVQEVLFWQYRTQCFMNQMVHRTIEEVFGSSPNRPQVSDYLNFYCLGARETPAGSEAQIHDPMMLPKATEVDKALHATRRFCVYVHSKMMIVDDAYVVVGSANINERSMSGYRDTEIAMGAFQPSYYSGPVGSAGKVHQFRLSLWAEHTGICHPIFSRPNSVECAQLMNRLADENWEAFIGQEVVDLKGHLLRYPIRVDPATGKTTSTTEFIPETKGKFKGTKSFLLADKLTS